MFNTLAEGNLHVTKSILSDSVWCLMQLFDWYFDMKADSRITCIGLSQRLVTASDTVFRPLFSTMSPDFAISSPGFTFSDASHFSSCKSNIL